MKVVTSYLLGLTGALGVAGLAQFLSYQTQPKRQSEFDLGPAAAFEAGSRTRFDEVPALLIRGDSGFEALSLTCTHLGCTVGQAPEGFECPCHGSRYDDQGDVLRGPAVKSLRKLRTEINADGRLILYIDPAAQ